MAVRSKRLFGPEPIGTTSELIYTCPAGETALIKHLSLFNQGALTATVVIGINGIGANQNVVSTQVGAGLASQLTSLFIVLHPGDFLRANCSAGNFTVTGYGAELEGVAD